MRLLARRLRLAPNSVTTVASGLKSSGLITRAPADKDAQAVVLTLTGDGLRELTPGDRRDRRPGTSR